MTGNVGKIDNLSCYSFTDSVVGTSKMFLVTVHERKASHSSQRCNGRKLVAIAMVSIVHAIRPPTPSTTSTAVPILLFCLLQRDTPIHFYSAFLDSVGRDLMEVTLDSESYSEVFET